MKCFRLLIAIILFITVVYFYPGCNKNPVSAPFDIRKLTWSIDTLAHPDNWQTIMYSVWGNSADDVYAVGTANTTRGILWRHTLEQWFDTKVSATAGGPIIGSISFRQVFGFGKNDVWVCGKFLTTNPDTASPSNFIQHSLLIHWDGFKWRKIETPAGNKLHSIWGQAPNDIWTGGTNGTIFHYDGAIVKKDTLPFSIPNETAQVWNVLSITGDETETYMLLRAPDPPRLYLLTHRNEQWVVEDTLIFQPDAIWMSPSGTLYAAGITSHKRQGKTWEKILDGNNTLWAWRIYGTNDDNLFAVGHSFDGYGAVYHFDGSDWFSYKELEIPGVDYFDVWTDGKEVFVTGKAGSGTIVLHGK